MGVANCLRRYLRLSDGLIKFGLVLCVLLEIQQVLIDCLECWLPTLNVEWALSLPRIGLGQVQFGWHMMDDMMSVMLCE